MPDLLPPPYPPGFEPPQFHPRLYLLGVLFACGFWRAWVWQRCNSRVLRNRNNTTQAGVGPQKNRWKNLTVKTAKECTFADFAFLRPLR